MVSLHWKAFMPVAGMVPKPTPTHIFLHSRRATPHNIGGCAHCRSHLESKCPTKTSSFPVTLFFEYQNNNQNTFDHLSHSLSFAITTKERHHHLSLRKDASQYLHCAPHRLRRHRVCTVGRSSIDTQTEALTWWYRTGNMTALGNAAPTGIFPMANGTAMQPSGTGVGVTGATGTSTAPIDNGMGGAASTGAASQLSGSMIGLIAAGGLALVCLLGQILEHDADSYRSYKDRIATTWAWYDSICQTA